MSVLMPQQNALRKIKVTMISTITPTPIPTHQSSGQQGWKTLPQLAYQMLLTSANKGLQRQALHFSKCYKIPITNN